VLALGQPRILNDLAAYVRDRHEPTATSVLVEEGYAASLTAPLRHGDRDLGFLFFNSRTAGAYHTEHAETIRRIAHAVAGVVAEIGVRGNTDEAWASVLGSSLTAIVRAARQAHEEEELLARVVAASAARRRSPRCSTPSTSRSARCSRSIASASRASTRRPAPRRRSGRGRTRASASAPASSSRCTRRRCPW
jgi:antirestriction protein ArdC